ncbi:helix-turn-helix domain-containing protein [Gloeocapsopsis dulcis]|uniref:XRE family transcriptional regulator n=1 Tax=Gloeocapsopsis dulcis AAB1 = 1H9 TaxID=1433147 RepID=A0A6N8G1Y7_9CHRO|nr:helix-turn-helix transcriptional regulator [Gloeocapsopsis dulcis]MUL39428.1 XRE family transcriptional regulator [Gloeocapsopsis dulcis AAB1 = 1H9]WNN92348.1 helix-turn-helix transcriptional regulator [Gloeocapsopsis dulcis]
MKADKSIDVSLGSDNIFADLGFDTEEATNLKVRADLMLDLRNYIELQGWTQEQAAAFFGETQPRISNLINGEISRFSVDKLLNMLGRAGMQVRVEVLPKAV